MGFWGDIDEDRIFNATGKRHPEEEGNENDIRVEIVSGNYDQSEISEQTKQTLATFPESVVGADVFSDSHDGQVRVGRYLYLGQVAGLYLVLRDADDSLLLLDRHAVYERVLYARMRRGEFAGAGQLLALPLELPLQSAEREHFYQLRDTLATLGFALECVEQTLRVLSIPPVLDRTTAQKFLREAVTGDKDNLSTLFISLSCKATIETRQRLTPDEAAGLISQWMNTPDRDLGIHGRPCVLRWTSTDLEKLFKRKP